MALLRYTLLRVGLLLAVAALLWLVGLRGIVLWLFAILVSGIVSIFVLNRSRDAASASLADRIDTAHDRLAADDGGGEGDERPRIEHPRPGYPDPMTEDRRTKETPATGEDPREIDRERATDAALEEMAGYDGLVRPKDPTGATGSTAEQSPGRDLDDLEDAPEVPEYRDHS